MEKGKKKFSLIKIIFMGMLFLCLFSFVLPFCMNINIAFAADNLYTDVLTDLEKDSAFNEEDYPVITNDYTLKVIQIAESINDELFIYVYQPCSPNEDLKATSISISTGNDEEYLPILYKLEFLNSYNCLFKYKVKNFNISKTDIRFYEIVSIYRNWNEKYDKKTGTNNTISEVSFEVGKQYSVAGFGEKITYSVSDVEVVRVTDKYVGFVRYNGGYQWNGITYEKADNHFVAFSTDHDMDVLLETDVYYSDRSYYYYYKKSLTQLTSPTTKYGDVKEHIVNLRYDTEEEYQGNIFHKKYTWKQISTSQEFISNEDTEYVYHIALVGDVRTQTKLSEEGTSNILDKQWVLRFATTDYTYTHLNGFIGDSQISDDITETNATQVMDVSILRLKFESEGKVFNLGVVDNKQSGDLEPDNDTDVELKPSNWIQAIINFFKKYWKIILIVLAVIFGMPLIIACVPIINIIIKSVVQVVIWIFKGLWWLVSLPFKIFKRRDG